jgi:hypothetical protein
VERDGKPYCTVHDPVRREKIHKEKMLQEDARWKKKEQSYNWEKAANALCSGVDTQTLERLGSGWLLNHLPSQS